jgi:hypothetical protein
MTLFRAPVFLTGGKFEPENMTLLKLLFRRK